MNVCPTATINAPIERVWNLLANPGTYARWWDAVTRRIDPEGPAQSDQNIFAQTRALGRWWNVRIVVNSVTKSKYHIELTTRLPFGIIVHNHIIGAPLDATHSRVTFG